MDPRNCFVRPILRNVSRMGFFHALEVLGVDFSGGFSRRLLFSLLVD